MDEADERWEVRQTTINRAGHRCEAGDGAFDMQCGGPLDCHEIVARSVYPGAHLDVTVTAAVCRLHHGAVDLYPEEAYRLGLKFRSWQIDEARSRRAQPLRSLG